MVSEAEEEPQAATGAEFGAIEARRVVDTVCAAVDLDPSGARLMRLGEHAVFRLASAPVVVRVGRSSAYADGAARELAVSAWLNGNGVSAVRAATDAAQPIVVDGRVVTFWEAIGSGDEYASVVEFADLLRRFHALTPPEGLMLPALEPFAKARSRVHGAGGLDAADRQFLLDRVERLDEAYRSLAFVLPAGSIHGDANVGNVLRDDTGQPFLIDLDGFSIGPREWDLILTAMYAHDYGWHTAEEYAAFVETYGFDVTTWEGYPVLRDIRETVMVTWMAQNVAGDEATAAEFGKRMRALRSGGSRRDWSPF